MMTTQHASGKFRAAAPVPLAIAEPSSESSDTGRVRHRHHDNDDNDEKDDHDIPVTGIFLFRCSQQLCQKNSTGY